MDAKGIAKTDKQKEEEAETGEVKDEDKKDDKEKKKKTLTIKVVKAKKLKSSLLDTIDPFIKLTYNGESKKTSVKDNNENPRWDEDLEFVADDEKKTVNLQLFD